MEYLKLFLNVGIAHVVVPALFINFIIEGSKPLAHMCTHVKHKLIYNAMLCVLGMLYGFVCFWVFNMTLEHSVLYCLGVPCVAWAFYRVKIFQFLRILLARLMHRLTR